MIIYSDITHPTGGPMTSRMQAWAEEEPCLFGRPGERSLYGEPTPEAVARAVKDYGHLRTAVAAEMFRTRAG